MGTLQPAAVITFRWVTKILAEPGTLTGSIGVVTGSSPSKDDGQVGITVDAISRGRIAAGCQRRAIQRFGEGRRYADREGLLSAVHREGGSRPEFGIEDARIACRRRLYTGRMAKQCKLVDEIGTLKAPCGGKRLAGVKADDKISG